MEQHSFKIIFFDINKTIIDEKKVIKDGDELKKEIKERFKFLDSIINNFIDTHLLIDVENEEKFSLKQTYFIYQIEKGVTKSYYFYLVRKLDIKIFNNIINAVFIIIDLEKDNSIELLGRILSKTEDNTLITSFNDRIDALDYFSDDEKASYKAYTTISLTIKELI